MISRLAALVTLCLLSAAALGASVTGPLGADTLGLADGTRIRLAGIDAPLAAEAERLLAERFSGRDIVLRDGPEGPDRHGRIVAHVFRDDGVWAEGELLRLGLARVRTTIEDRARAAEMLAHEAEARAARRGLWRSPAYAVRRPDEVGARLQSFEIVEGTIVSAARRRADVFLDFGPDWRSDFSVRVPRSALKLFKAAKLDPLALEGRRVRVRGWVFRQNGPMIEASHPEQIELVAGE